MDLGVLNHESDSFKREKGYLTTLLNMIAISVLEENS